MSGRALPRVSETILSPGRLSDHYTVVMGDKLGEGAFSQVFACTHKESGARRALKRIDKKHMQHNYKIDLQPVEVEVTLHKRCCKGATNIVQLYDVYDSNTTVDIAMEAMAKKDLFDVIDERFYDEKKDYTEVEAANIIKQIINAVHACHDNHVTHRDIKPENILVNESSSGKDTHLDLKLSDFGLAAEIRGNLLFEPCGTPEYVAPEVIMNEGYKESADVWSIGVILFILLSGSQPFEADSSAENDSDRTQSVLNQLRKHKDIDHKLAGPGPWKEVSDEAKEVLHRMFLVDPAARISCKELLEHPWINGGGKSTANEAALYALHKGVVKRKFRAAFRALVITRRIQNFIQGLRAEKVCDEVCRERNWGVKEAHLLLDVFRGETSTGRLTPRSTAAMLVKKAAFEGIMAKAPFSLEAQIVADHYNAFANSDGLVNCRDYVVAVAWRSESSQDEKLGFAFDVFDTSGDGNIDEEEFAILMNTVFATKPKMLSNAEIAAEFAKIDEDGSGSVERSEFMAYAISNESISRYLQQVSTQVKKKDALAGVKEEVAAVSAQLEKVEAESGERARLAGEAAPDDVTVAKKEGGCCIVM